MPATPAPRRFLQLDVFADRPGAGNPLAVVMDSDGLDDATMQAFARWTNLSETAFLLPPGDGADYRVRIFTPRQELPFAGHPSVGAAWAALDQGLVAPRDGALVQDCAAGRLPVTVSDDGAHRLVSLRAPQARRLDAPEGSRPRLDAALYGLPRGALAPALWDNGPRWWIAELASAAAVRAMQPDLAAIAALTGTSEVGMAVFAYDETGEHDVVVRGFCPVDGIPEDPVTGSVNALIAAALHADGRLARGARYIASQGREVCRDGRIEVRVDDAGAVWIGGRVQPVIRGTVDWPSASIDAGSR